MGPEDAVVLAVSGQVGIEADVALRVVLGEPPGDPPGDEPFAFGSSWLLPVAKAKSGRRCRMSRFSVTCLRRWSTASTIALDSGRTPAARGPLSNRLIVRPPSCRRASCWKPNRVPLPIEKSLRLPPSRQRTFPVRRAILYSAEVLRAETRRLPSPSTSIPLMWK
jgi:hypothetical protein